jgi:hypothetical protein
MAQTGARAHEGKSVADRVDEMWGMDMAQTVITGAGGASQWRPTEVIRITWRTVLTAIFVGVLGGATPAESAGDLAPSAAKSNPPAEGANPPAAPAAPAPAPAAGFGLAGPPKPDSVATTGVESRVAQVFDCKLKDRMPVVSARADHGAVVVRESTGAGCGQQNVRGAGIFYKSEDGFSGEDKIYILGFTTEKERIDTIFRVQVNDPFKPDAVAESGVESQVGSVSDCNAKDRPPVVSARADHGAIVIRESTGPGCGEENVRSAGIFYTSRPGFRGKEFVHVSASVAKKRVNGILRVRVK